LLDAAAMMRAITRHQDADTLMLLLITPPIID